MGDWWLLCAGSMPGVWREFCMAVSLSFVFRGGGRAFNVPSAVRSRGQVLSRGMSVGGEASFQPGWLRAARGGCKQIVASSNQSRPGVRLGGMATSGFSGRGRGGDTIVVAAYSTVGMHGLGVGVAGVDGREMEFGGDGVLAGSLSGGLCRGEMDQSMGLIACRPRGFHHFADAGWLAGLWLYGRESPH
jgi:hypothetical protein